jgi:signal transduction histidine kinase
MQKRMTESSPEVTKNNASTTAKVDFMAGGGEMGTLMRALDWSTTPLGKIEQWPQSLRTAVSILLNSRFPMFLFWGVEATCLYNDGYRPSLGAQKHPKALGQRGRECWDDIWHIIGPQIAAVMTDGEPTWYEDQLVPFDRNGYFEEIYFTYSYSPVRDEAGVGGTLVVCTETSKHVIGERRLRILRELAAKAAIVNQVSDAYAHSLEILRQSNQDIPFALLYQLDSDAYQAHLVGAANLPDDHAAYLPLLQLQEAEPNSTWPGWPLLEAMHTPQSLFVTDLPNQFGLLPGGAWPEATHSALIVPITQSGQSQPTGFFVAGISPRKAFDDDYRGFLELAAGYVGTAVSNARAYEAERRRAETLAELDRAKTTFFNNISHEFRTPLTLMLGPAEDALADQTQPLPARQQERVTVIYRNCLRLLKLVNTLLDFSRIEAGRSQAVYEPVDLAAFTTELASVFRSAIERAGLRLVVDCPPLPQLIYVDKEMWEKIVLNLLSNALKFTFAGEIAVTLRALNNQIELEIRDTGTGIPAEHLPHLFERFHRVQGAIGRTHEGSGIGLALVQELTQLHGGSVRFCRNHSHGHNPFAC